MWELASNRVGWLPFLICFSSVHIRSELVVFHLLLDEPEYVDVFLYAKNHDFNQSYSKIAIEGMRFNEISICQVADQEEHGFRKSPVKEPL